MKSFGNIAKDGQVRAVASGTLTDGKAVIVNANGTVSAVASTGKAAGVGSKTTFESGQVDEMGGTYDSNTNRVVFCYQDVGNSSYGTAVAGTVSGTSITFGTPVVYSSATTSNSKATFDSNANKVAIFYRTTNSHGIVATTSSSDNSLSFGSATQFDTTSNSRFSCTFDSSNNKCVAAYSSYNPGTNARAGRAVVGTISGTSISFGSTVDFFNHTIESSSCTFDSNSNKVVIFYSQENDSSNFKCVVGTVSGTSISFGSVVAVGGRGNGLASTFDSNSNKVVVIGRDINSSNKGIVKVGTVSGTSISFGTGVQIGTYAIDREDVKASLSFDTTNNKVGIGYADETNSKGKFISGSVSGTSITFDSEQTYEASGKPTQIAACVYDDNADSFVVGYGEFSTSIGRANVIDIDTLVTNVTSENFIGFSDGAFATTQSASINTTNTIDRNQSGLTAGQTYFVQTDGTLGLTAADPSVTAGTAISSTELIVKG